MAIITEDGLIDALGNASQHFVFNKASIATQIAGGYSSFWRGTGTPAQGAIPTAAAVVDKSLAGAFQWTNPAGGLRSYIGWMFAISSIAGTDLQMHDRLAHMGGLLGNNTTSQTVGLNAADAALVNRRGDTNYSDVQWWLEWYTATGATATVATITYTSADGTTGRTTTVSILASTAASRMLPIIGAGGEFIQSIQSVQLSVSSATAGNFGVTATRAITSMSLGLANFGQISNVIDLGMPRVYDDAALMFILITGSTSTGTLIGSAKLIQG